MRTGLTESYRLVKEPFAEFQVMFMCRRVVQVIV
jgi:hypothetical protein